MSLKICNPTRLLVEAASFLALQVTQPYTSQIPKHLDSPGETLVRRIALVRYDALQPLPQFLALVERHRLFVVLPYLLC